MSNVDILLNHKSIRKYTDKPIDREIVDTIIRSAQMAPTSCHFQAYTIIEVRDKRKREFLSEISGGQKWVIEAPLVLMFCGDLHRGKEYYDNTDPEVFRNTEQYTVGVIDAALAGQKALIAAQLMGLGGVFVGGIRNDVESITKEFRLPELVYPLFAICFGYPDDDPGLKPRLPKDVIHKIDFYDESRDKELIAEYNETMRNYYLERTDGKDNSTWSQRCAKYLTGKTRDDVGEHFREIGLLRR